MNFNFRQAVAEVFEKNRATSPPTRALHNIAVNHYSSKIITNSSKRLQYQTELSQQKNHIDFKLSTDQF